MAELNLRTRLGYQGLRHLGSVVVPLLVARDTWRSRGLRYETGTQNTARQSAPKIVIVVPEAEKDEALAYIVECMSTPPEWARGLPVTCEAKYAQTYGEC